MQDIDRALLKARSTELDPFGRYQDLNRWSPLSANRFAELVGPVLGEEQRAVTCCLPERYRLDNANRTARRLTRAMETGFADQGGRRYLDQRFPRGPLMPACKIADLPLREGTLSTSFGSVP